MCPGESTQGSSKATNVRSSEQLTDSRHGTAPASFLHRNRDDIEEEISSTRVAFSENLKKLKSHVSLDLFRG